MSTYSSGAGAGPNLDKVCWRAYNRTGAAVTVGQFVLFDDASGQSETTAATGGALGNVIMPTTAGLGNAAAAPGYRGAVVVGLGAESGADNTLIDVQVSGIAYVQITAAQDLIFGDLLCGINGAGTMSETTTQYQKVYAKAEEEIASAVAGTLYKVHLEGLVGFGRIH